METCTACNGWFDPRTEGVVQADLFSPAALTLCGICYAKKERAAREAEARTHLAMTRAALSELEAAGLAESSIDPKRGRIWRTTDAGMTAKLEE